MRIGETHSSRGQPIDTRSGYLALRVVAFDVAVSKVVTEDKNNVGPGVAGSRRAVTRRRFRSIGTMYERDARHGKTERTI
jgi:hypothetical protein